MFSILCIVSLLIPYPSVQHFIWPLHWCLLADICNHTYIPECATETGSSIFDRQLFIDECDLYEYNCDYETDFYPINYTDCFNLPPRPCPTFAPCPPIPPCPEPGNLSVGQAPFRTARRKAVRKISSPHPLPERMLKGKRRYSPTWRKKRTTKRMQKNTAITKRTPMTTRTKIVKKFTVRRNGKVFLKVIKAVVKKGPAKKSKIDSDFLE